MMKALRWALLPVSLLYAILIWIRNKLYDRGILSSRKYDIPTIVVGNLAIGGSGKTPMTEYLVHWLKKQYTIAILSRGYGRKTRGFRYVLPQSTASESGDEPLQFKHKFPSVTVAVAEDRRLGIEKLRADHQLIILDDAYQHRRISGTCNILLFDYQSLQKPILPLPTGNFRDLMTQSRRAHLIVITKCPAKLTDNAKTKLEKKIRQYSTAPMFFARIAYGQPLSLRDGHPLESLTDKHILVVTGIANPSPLYEYLSTRTRSLTLIAFADHHHFTNRDYDRIKSAYARIRDPSAILLTTEKDSQRLQWNLLPAIPSYYLPVSVLIDYETSFRQAVINTIRPNNVNIY